MEVLGYQVIVLGRHLERFRVQKFFESGPEAVEVGLAENLSASKSGFFNIHLEFLPQNQLADPRIIMNHVVTVLTYHLKKNRWIGPKMTELLQIFLN